MYKQESVYCFLLFPIGTFSFTIYKLVKFLVSRRKNWKKNINNLTRQSKVNVLLY